MKPYVVATSAILADAPYMGGIGGGLTVHAKAGNVSLDPYAEIVQQSFRNSTFYPLATGLSGTLSTVGVQAYGPIASGLSWQSRVAFAHANDQSAFDSYNSFAADIWLPWLVSWGGMRPWTIVPTAGVTTWRYGAPDPFVAPFTTAHITEWRVGLGLEVPIWRQLAIGSLLQYRNGTSNVSSKFGQDGGVPGLKSLNTTGLQPPWPWLPTNTGENDALQILIESTKLATQPNPPQQPPPQTGSNIRSNLP